MGQQQMMQTINLALVNGWSNYGASWDDAKAFKIGKVVYLKGLVKGGADGAVVATLPGGWRPSKQRIFCVSQHGQKSVRIDIRSNGQIFPETLARDVNPGGWIPLDGIQFVVD